MSAHDDPLVFLIAGLILIVAFIRWGTRSIPHAIVFVVLFPILLCIALAFLSASHEDTQRVSAQPQPGPPMQLGRHKGRDL